MTTVLRHGDTDMTQGGVARHLIMFSLPLLIGNVFQQLYNTVDSIVVGNYVSKQALAAVGCTGPIINTLIGLFTGLATGAGVVISQFYGARDRDKLHKTVQTTVALTCIMSVLLTALGVLLTPAMLRLMVTPEDVFDDAVMYLRIYFWGVSGLLFYNIGSGILRAVGDSTRPLYFLIFSALTNTVLDIVFVKYMDMGIAGAAIATISAQFMSAMLVMLLLSRSKSDYRVELRAISIHGGVLRRICAMGIPTSLQLGITAFSNIFVQSYVNRFASSCMAGWAAYTKIDAFAMMPLMSLSMAITTFVGQNLGAGSYERARSGAKYGAAIGAVIVAVVVTPLVILAPQLTAMFNREPEVLEYGSFFIRLISPFYIAFGINQVYSGALRGAGEARPTMLIMLFSFVLFRQMYLFAAYRLGGGIVSIGLGYPVGWMMCSTLLLIYYYRGGWMKRIQAHAADGTNPPLTDRN